MMENMKKKELNEQEMSGVAGGIVGADMALYWQKMEKEMQKQEEARQKAMQYEAARQEAIRQAEAANQPGTHAHGGGVSGGW
jgi:hypothetical protein